MSIACFRPQLSFTFVQDSSILGKTPVGINTATRTDAIDPRISIALDIISRVCDDPENLVQDVLREEQGHKVCVKRLHCWQLLLICLHVAIKSHLYNFYTQKSSIIAQLVFLLDHLAKNLTARELPVARKTVEALIQICFGNFSNQQVAIQGQVVVSINCLLGTIFSIHLVIAKFRFKCTSTVLALSTFVFY